jgi:urea transporter
MGPEVFSGLAHFIKGGVFFWYGILTLGRWAGCFANIGWVSFAISATLQKGHY